MTTPSAALQVACAILLACAVACSALPMKSKEVVQLKAFSAQAGKVNHELNQATSELMEMQADFKADEKAGGKDLEVITKKVNAEGDKLPDLFDQQTDKLEPLTRNAKLGNSPTGTKMAASVKHMDGEFHTVEKDSNILTKDFKEHRAELMKMGTTNTAPKWYFNDEKVLGDVKKQLDGITKDNNNLKGLADAEIKNKQ